MNRNNDYLNYNNMLDSALISVVKNALEQVVANGLLDGHYFYFTFNINARGVIVPEFLRKQYPETLTIVIQHEYSNLSVSEKEFGVTLSFNNYSYHIIVPFNSLIAFSDPKVNFSLSFNIKEDEIEEEDKEPELSYTDDGSNIISISDFMKKNLPTDDDVA